MPAEIDRMRKVRQGGGERGFVLLVVLSVLGLLALVVATFAHITRAHVRTAAAAVESARAEALADAGVNLAILDLITAREAQATDRRFALNAVPVRCAFENGAAMLTIAVQDEAGKVDLNIGSEPVLRALVLGTGVGAGEATVEAILDFRDADDDRRPSGAERAEYRAAGRAYGPKNAAFHVVEELAGVLGLTQADVDRLRPFVTVYSGQTAIDLSVAPAALVDVLSRGVSEGGSLAFKAASGGGARSVFGAAPLPDALIMASVRRAFSVRSEAHMPGGAVFVREAIVEMTASRATPYVVRRWTRGAARIDGNSTLEAAGHSPC